MNKELLQSCKDVMQTLSRRPIIHFFWNTNVTPNPTGSSPTSIELISLKLEKNTYSSYNEWVLDVRNLFDFYINNSQSQIYIFSAKQLRMEFDQLISTFASNKSNRLNKLNKLYKDLLDLAETYEAEFQEVQEDLQPAAELFKLDISSITDPIKIIQRNCAMFKSSEVILRVAAILYKLQPEAIIVNSQQIRFEFGLMTPDTCQEMLKYTMFLLKSIAIGKIDPSSNSQESILDSYKFS